MQIVRYREGSNPEDEAPGDHYYILFSQKEWIILFIFIVNNVWNKINHLNNPILVKYLYLKQFTGYRCFN